MIKKKMDNERLIELGFILFFLIIIVFFAIVTEYEEPRLIELGTQSFIEERFELPENFIIDPRLLNLSELEKNE